ncbi:hypothetical protein [Planococcus halotolerans]|uniref:OmpH family outer membrane protein n=1 Tax=Planococcus halotolerans TaxID=2233542 RepID=A0A365L720_9BACL|nr:hypothetical protein [Planococcus halotolerans]QHJ70243.1 hypothetical protein DNR44_006355 [Planococcus halotolerans]RAZ81027.1 hypothetical protein DP120_01700 [Planococcus halotolerans]
MLKKYSITALFSLLLIFAAYTGGGFAETTEPAMSPETATALAEVYKVNNEIYAEIAKVQVKAENMYADYLAEAAKTTDAQKKAEAWNKYDVKVEAEIADLSSKTQAMTLKGMEKATAAGLTVEMEWIQVQFADRVRMIDPIKVMDW